MLTDWEFSVFSQVSRLCQGRKPGQIFPADLALSPKAPLLLLHFHFFLHIRSLFIERCENDYDESANTPMVLAKKPRMGYFCFCSNLDTEPKEIYLDYKERWDIEECFDYLKNSVSAESPHAHNNEYFRGWAFLNHISLLYNYGLINAINVHHLSENLTPREAILMTKDICRITDPDGKQQLTHIKTETQEILDTLGVVLSAT